MPNKLGTTIGLRCPLVGKYFLGQHINCLSIAIYVVDQQMHTGKILFVLYY